MSRFVLTAQVQLQAPNNVRQVVNQIQNQLAGVNIPVNVQNAASATRQINQIRAATNDATTAAERMGAAFGVSLKRFASFSIATRAVGLFTNGLAGAIKDAIEFERQLIKVAQVSNQSVASLKGLTSTITELATSLGVESKSLLEVSTILKQAGLSANDTAIALRTLAKAALAPNFDSITETTEGAIAVLAQFGLGVQALEGQLSSIDAVAGAFAVEAADLIDVIRRTGGVFKSSGGDLNELLALFTSVRATTRESAESIGTGLRTIFTRIQRPKTIEYLKQFGIELVDLEGRFVGPFEAVKRLSAALNGLGEGDLTFIRIAEELGGFRQIGKVLPLLQQFAVAQQALNVAQKAGDGLTTNAITAQQALAIRITKVKEEFLAFVRGVTESRGFQLFVNTALNLASAFIKIGEALTPVIPLLTAMMAINISRGIGSFLTSIPRGISSNRFSKGGAVLGFNSGGIVPGVGNRDSVPAMLTPGEVVVNKTAAQKYGSGNIDNLNRGGRVQKFWSGGISRLGGNIGTLNVKDPTGKNIGIANDKYSIKTDKKPIVISRIQKDQNRKTNFVDATYKGQNYSDIDVSGGKEPWRRFEIIAQAVTGSSWANDRDKTYPIDLAKSGHLFEVKYKEAPEPDQNMAAKSLRHHFIAENIGFRSGSPKNTIVTLNTPPNNITGNLTPNTDNLTSTDDITQLYPLFRVRKEDVRNESISSSIERRKRDFRNYQGRKNRASLYAIRPMKRDLENAANTDSDTLDISKGSYTSFTPEEQRLNIGGLIQNFRSGSKDGVQKRRGFFFDFDDTLATTGAIIRPENEDPYADFRGELGKKLLESATATKYAQMARKKQVEGYDTWVLTARPGDKETIGGIKSFGSSNSLSFKGIIGVGNIATKKGIDSAKAKSLILSRYAKNYPDGMVFVDDLEENHLAAQEEMSQANVSFKSVLARKSLGGLIQRFEEGGVAQRRVGIIDTDVLRDKKNAARVAEGMQLLGATSEADYGIKLSKLAGEARQSGALGRFSVMAGAAANRKSSVATGRGAKDDATLRKTTRKHIIHPDDLKDVDQVMSLTTTLKDSKLDYMGMADRIYSKDSSTEDEQKLVKLFERQRNLQKDPTLYGRETGTTEGLNPDYGLQTASLISQFGTTEDRTNKGKVMTLGEKTDQEGNPRFQVRRKRLEELPELVSAKGQFPGAASPLTRGHAETAVGTLLAKVREKYPDATHKDLLFALAPDLSLSGGSQGREHGARYGEYPASFRRDLIKLALPEMMISSANSPSQTGINSRIAEIEKGATGRRRFAVMEKDAPVVISKAENENPEGVMERYRSAGLTPYNIARSSDVEGDSISGTATRQAVIDKDYTKLDLAVLPKVGSAIKANQPQLRNRRMMVPLVQRALDIFTQANTSKVNEQVDEILKNASGGPFTRMTPKFKEAHPNLVKQIKQLRTSRDIFERETFLDPAHELIRIISDRYPDIYGLDVTRQEPLDIPVTEDTVKQHIVDSSKLSSYFRPGLSFNGDAVQLSPTLQKVKDTVEKEVKSEPVIAPQEVKEIVAPKSRSEIFKVLSRDEAAIASGVDKLKVYDIMGLRRELTPAEQKVQEAVREAYVNKIKRKGAASKAQTTKLRTKGLEFGAAGLLGKAFAAKNIKIESDKLSSSRMVRVVSGVMDKATATKLSTTMSQGVSDIISQGTSIVQSGSKATTTPSIQGLNANTNATIQGGLIEQIIQNLGGPGAVKGKGFDFPEGLQGAAKYFNIDPNIPTDVKRTLSGPSTIKDNIVTYLKNVMGYVSGGLVQNFEDGGKSIADLKNYRLNAREYRDKVNLDSLMKDDLPSKLYSGFKTTRRSIIEKGLAGEKGYDPNKLINKIFTMPSYLSTSSTEGGGKSFSDIKGGLMHIKTSPQRKGIDVLSTIGSGSASKLYEREAEFILPKNSSFKINEVLKTDGPFGWRKEWGSPDFLEIGVNQLAGGGRLGFETGGTVPALVSNGEAYVPPKVAKRIGYGTLNRMNQADRNGMGRFSGGGGISVFKGPGTGTSDSIPTSLPVGSFIIREKATKALGLNRGGSVGGVRRFVKGGQNTKDAVRAQGDILQNLDQATSVFSDIMSQLPEQIRKTILDKFRGVKDVKVGESISKGIQPFEEGTRGQAVFNTRASAIGLKITGKKGGATTETVAHETGHLADAELGGGKDFASNIEGTFQFELVKKVRSEMEKAFISSGESAKRMTNYLLLGEELFAEFFAKASPEVRAIITSTTDAKKGMEQLANVLGETGYTYAGLEASDISTPRPKTQAASMGMSTSDVLNSARSQSIPSVESSPPLPGESPQSAVKSEDCVKLCDPILDTLNNTLGQLLQSVQALASSISTSGVPSTGSGSGDSDPPKPQMSVVDANALASTSKSDMFKQSTDDLSKAKEVLTEDFKKQREELRKTAKSSTEYKQGLQEIDKAEKNRLKNINTELKAREQAPANAQRKKEVASQKRKEAAQSFMDDRNLNKVNTAISSRKGYTLDDEQLQRAATTVKAKFSKEREKAKSEATDKKDYEERIKVINQSESDQLKGINREANKRGIDIGGGGEKSNKSMFTFSQALTGASAALNGLIQTAGGTDDAFSRIASAALSSVTAISSSLSILESLAGIEIKGFSDIVEIPKKLGESFANVGAILDEKVAGFFGKSSNSPVFENLFKSVGAVAGAVAITASAFSAAAGILYSTSTTIADYDKAMADGNIALVGSLSARKTAEEDITKSGGYFAAGIVAVVAAVPLLLGAIFSLIPGFAGASAAAYAFALPVAVITAGLVAVGAIVLYATDNLEAFANGVRDIASYLTGGWIQSTATIQQFAQATAATSHTMKLMQDQAKQTTQALKDLSEGRKSAKEVLNQFSGQAQSVANAQSMATRLPQDTAQQKKDRDASIKQANENRDKVLSEAAPAINAQARNIAVAGGNFADFFASLPKELQALYNQNPEELKLLKEAFGNTAKEVEIARKQFEAMNLGLRNVTSVTGAAVNSVTNFTAGLQAGNLAVAQSANTLTAALTAAGANISQNDFNNALNDVTGTMQSLGASDQQVTKFKDNLTALAQVQRNAGGIFDQLKEDIKAGGFTNMSPEAAGDKFRTLVDQQLKDSGISDEARKRIGDALGDIEIGDEERKQIAAGDYSFLLKKLDEAGVGMTKEVNQMISDLQKVNSELNTLYKQRIESERSFVEAQRQSIALNLEGLEIQSKYGGKALTPEIRRQAAIESANAGRRIAGVGDIRGSDPASLRAGLNQIRGNFAALEQKALQGKVSGQEGVQDEAMRENLKKAQQDQVKLIKDLISAEEEQLKITKEKNKLEKDSLESLLAGDIDKFFEQQAAVGATAAIAAGNQAAINQFGGQALGGAYQNLQRQKEAGVTELFGQRIAGAGGLLESSAMASLGSRGIQNPRMAQILAGTTPEEEASNRRLREYGGLLGEAGAAGAEMAAMEVARAEMNIATAELKIQNAGLNTDILNNQPQNRSRGGIVYASKGQLINFVPKGTDTVPAMLTPGEFVVNRGAVNRGDNYSFLRAINNGHYTANAQKLNSNNTSIPNIIKQLTSNPQIAQTQDTHRQVVQNERNISNVNFDVQKLSKQLGKFMSGFDGFMENFSEQVGKLGNTEVSHKLGDVNLNINGGQFLQSMADGLKQQLMEDLGQKLQSIKVNNVGNIKLGRTSVL